MTKQTVKRPGETRSCKAREVTMRWFLKLAELECGFGMRTVSDVADGDMKCYTFSGESQARSLLRFLESRLAFSGYGD